MDLSAVPSRKKGEQFVVGFLICLGVAAAVVVGFVAYFLVSAPDTKAVPGSNLPKRHLETIRKLGLLDPREEIKFFYSDAFLSIRKGMYFFTDKKVVIYDEDLEKNPIILSYGEIMDIKAEFSDSWWENGAIWIKLKDGNDISIPISSEGGADHRFFESMVSLWKEQREESR